MYTIHRLFPSKVQQPVAFPHQRGPAIWPSSALLDIPQSGSPDARESNVWVFSQFGGGAGSCFFFLIFYPVFVLGGAHNGFAGMSRKNFPILNEEHFENPQNSQHHRVVLFFYPSRATNLEIFR